MHRRDVLRAGTLSGLVLASGCSAVRSPANGDDSPLDEGYEPLGSVTLDLAAEAVVGDDGETAYLATVDGFAAVDVSDPTDPAVVRTVDEVPADGDRTLTQILDVDVDGDRLVVPGPGNRIPGAFSGLLLYDVSDPGDPRPVTDLYETDSHIHNCTLADDLLYVVINDGEANPLVILDVSDDEIEEVGRWSLLDVEPAWGEVHWILRYLHDVTVRDGLAVLAYWDAGTYLLDVSDPAEPEYVTHVRDPEVDLDEQRAIPHDDEQRVRAAQYGLPGNDHYSAVDDAGEVLAVGRESWATPSSGSAGAGGIDLYDLADPAEPAHLATIDPPEADDERYSGTWTTAHNFELRDGRLFSAWYQGGVKIHDVTDPAAPTELASWRDPPNAGFFTARVAEPGDHFVASSTTLIPNADTEGALYTFPIREGEQVDQPPLDGSDD